MLNFFGATKRNETKRIEYPTVQILCSEEFSVCLWCLLEILFCCFLLLTATFGYLINERKSFSSTNSADFCLFVYLFILQLSSVWKYKRKLREQKPCPNLTPLHREHFGMYVCMHLDDYFCFTYLLFEVDIILLLSKLHLGH